MAETRGIRKVSENILAPGRAMIVTEKDKDKYNWTEIPDGSIFIDTETGIQAVKLKGESDWVPSGIKNDGTINIAKDNINKVESFTIVQETVPDNPNEFIYTNSDGQQRHGLKEWNAAGTVLKGYIFTLERGTYIMHRNHLKVTIDDLLQRSVATGGVEEVSESRFRLTEQLVDNMEITVEYSAAFRMGSPYPRFFMNGEAPEASEVGDFWLDTDATLEEGGPIADEEMEDNRKIGWDRIDNHPDTLAGYGITDKVSREGHVHNAKDIIGMPTALPADGGHAETADTAIQAGFAKRADVTTMSNMAINDGANRNIVATYLTKDGEGATGTWPINITGTADSARKATCDAFGRDIPSTYLTENGGTLIDRLNFAGGTMNHVGDDAAFGSVNAGGMLGVQGLNAPTTFALLKRGDDKDKATISYDGDHVVFNKTIDADITGNAATASQVEWADVLNKPDFEQIMSQKAKRSAVTERIENGTTAMSFQWKEQSNPPEYLWGCDDAANSYIYYASSLNVSHAQTADTAKLLDGKSIGSGVGQIPVVQENGALPSDIIPQHFHSVSELSDPENMFIFGSKAPLSQKNGAIWFDTDDMRIKVCIDGKWKEFKSGPRDYAAESDNFDGESGIGIALTDPGHITGIWTRLSDASEGGSGEINDPDAEKIKKAMEALDSKEVPITPANCAAPKPSNCAQPSNCNCNCNCNCKPKELTRDEIEKLIANLHITANLYITHKSMGVQVYDENGREHKVQHEFATGYRMTISISNYGNRLKDLKLKDLDGNIITTPYITINKLLGGYEDMTEFDKREYGTDKWSYTSYSRYLSPDTRKYKRELNFDGHPLHDYWLRIAYREVLNGFDFIRSYESQGVTGNTKIYINSYSMNYGTGRNGSWQNFQNGWKF